MAFFTKRKIASLNYTLSREELQRRSRILVIDDERPDIIDDLVKSHFAVDYKPDMQADTIELVDRPMYDLILLDFGGVGSAFGKEQGLSLLRHIKRVNPAVVVLAYTSKALKSDHADFFRLVDGVLGKDAGITESLEKIEDGLRKAHSLPNVWNGLLILAGLQSGSQQDLELQDLFVRALTNQRARNHLGSQLTALLTSEASRTVGLLLLEKAVELGIKATLGA